jgi:Flp pilus assembly protein TadD
MGAPHAGIAICQHALERDPDSPCLHRQMGRLLLRIGSVPDALRSLQRAAELSPRHYDTHYYVGLALRRAGRMSEARQALRNALSLRPEDPKLYYALGLCCESDADGPEPARLLLEGLAAEQLAAGLEPPAALF